MAPSYLSEFSFGAGRAEATAGCLHRAKAAAEAGMRPGGGRAQLRQSSARLD